MATDGITSTNAAAIKQAQENAAAAAEKGLVLESIFYQFTGAVLGQDDVLQGYLDEMSKQTETLTAINELLQYINAMKGNLQENEPGYVGETMMVNGEKVQMTAELLNAKLASLKGTGVISYTFPEIIDPKDRPKAIKDLEALQSSLSTAQSSQGALNEDLSLKMNQAASSRAAMLTQLQTLLQTIMQTRQQLARF